MPSTPSGFRQPSNAKRLSLRRYNYALMIMGFFIFMAPVFAHATTYYLSATGNDSNSGRASNVAWLTPNHSVSCGDVILAEPSTDYSWSNFYTGKWGTVSCAGENNVAWLKCSTFDACKIHTSENQGMWVDKSYWGVQGWEITTTASDTYGTCFIAQPNSSSPAEISHIIFANNVANGCSQSGFASVNHGYVGVDYFAVIGNIAYDAAQGSGTCTSGISIYQPVQADSAAGTHIFVAGNFSYANLNPSECDGRTPTDGEGIILDTFDGSQGGLPHPYAGQTVAENNIVVGNGGKGVEVYNNTAGSAHASVYIKHNTAWGDLTDPNQNWSGCGELAITAASDIQASDNLLSTKSATGCGGHSIYAMALSQGNSSDSVSSNVAYGYSGNNTFIWDSGSFGYNSNNSLGMNPAFTHPVVPPAPSCGTASNVPTCMASVISDFAPKTESAITLGYQKTSNTEVADALFPKWVCTSDIPAGLITMGCK